MRLHNMAPPTLAVGSPGSSSNRTAVRRTMWTRVYGTCTTPRSVHPEKSGLGKSVTSYTRQLQRGFGAVFLSGDAVRLEKKSCVHCRGYCGLMINGMDYWCGNALRSMPG